MVQQHGEEPRYIHLGMGYHKHGEKLGKRLEGLETFFRQSNCTTSFRIAQEKKNARFS